MDLLISSILNNTTSCSVRVFGGFCEPHTGAWTQLEGLPLSMISRLQGPPLKKTEGNTWIKNIETKKCNPC